MKANFKKVHTAKDLTISTIVVLIGAGLFFVNKGVGICIAAVGIVMLLIYKGAYKKDGQGVVLRKRSEDLCKCCKSSILDFLEGKDVVPQVIEGNEGGCVRLDVYFNEDEGVAYAQLFDFCNYTYEPLTDIVELHSPNAEKLISQF